MILGKKSTSRQSVLERGRDSMENLSLSLTSLSSSPQRSATQPSSHLLMQKRTIEIKLVSFLVDQGLLIVFFVSEKVSRKFHETFLVHEKKKIKKEGYIYRNIGRIGSEEVGS